MTSSLLDLIGQSVLARSLCLFLDNNTGRGSSQLARTPTNQQLKHVDDATSPRLCPNNRLVQCMNWRQARVCDCHCMCIIYTKCMLKIKCTVIMKLEPMLFLLFFFL